MTEDQYFARHPISPRNAYAEIQCSGSTSCSSNYLQEHPTSNLESNSPIMLQSQSDLSYQGNSHLAFSGNLDMTFDQGTEIQGFADPLPPGPLDLPFFRLSDDELWHFVFGSCKHPPKSLVKSNSKLVVTATIFSFSVGRLMGDWIIAAREERGTHGGGRVLFKWISEGFGVFCWWHILLLAPRELLATWCLDKLMRKGSKPPRVPSIPVLTWFGSQSQAIGVRSHAINATMKMKNKRSCFNAVRWLVSIVLGLFR